MNRDADALLLLKRSSTCVPAIGIDDAQFRTPHSQDVSSFSPQSQENVQLTSNLSRAESLSSSAHRSRSVHARPSLEHAESLLFLAESLQRYVSSYTELCVSIRGPLRDVIYDLKCIQVAAQHQHQQQQQQQRSLHQVSLMVAENTSDPSANFPLSPTSPSTPAPLDVGTPGGNSPQNSVISSFWSTPSPATPAGVVNAGHAPVVSGKLLIIGPARSGKTSVLALLEASQLTDSKDSADGESDTEKDEKDSTKNSDVTHSSSVAKTARTRAGGAEETHLNDSFGEYDLTSPCDDDDAHEESINSDGSIGSSSAMRIRSGRGAAKNSRNGSPVPKVSPVVSPVTTGLPASDQPASANSVGEGSNGWTINKWTTRDSSSEVGTTSLSKELQHNTISGILKDSVNISGGVQSQLSRQANTKKHNLSNVSVKSTGRRQGSAGNGLQNSSNVPFPGAEEGRDTNSSSHRKKARTSDTPRTSRTRITTTTHPPLLSPVSPPSTTVTVAVRSPEDNVVVSPFGSALSDSKMNRERVNFDDATPQPAAAVSSRTHNATIKSSVSESRDTSDAASKSSPLGGGENLTAFSVSSSSKRDMSGNFRAASNSGSPSTPLESVENGRKKTSHLQTDRSSQHASPERTVESTGDSRRRVSLPLGSGTDEDDLMFFNIHLSPNGPAHDGSSRYSPMLAPDPSVGGEKGVSTPQSLGALAGIRTISSMKSPSRHATREHATKGFQRAALLGASGQRPSATFISIPMFPTNNVADGRVTPPVSPTLVGTFFKCEFLPRFGVETAIDFVARMLRHRKSSRGFKLGSLVDMHQKDSVIVDELQTRSRGFSATVSAEASTPRGSEAAAEGPSNAVVVEHGATRPDLNGSALQTAASNRTSGIVFAKAPAYLYGLVAVATKSPLPVPPFHTLVLDTKMVGQTDLRTSPSPDTGARASPFRNDSLNKRQTRHGSTNSGVSTPLYTFPRTLHTRSESGSTIDAADGRKNFSFTKVTSIHGIDIKRVSNSHNNNSSSNNNTNYSSSNEDAEGRTPTPSIRVSPTKPTSHFASSVRLIPDEEKSLWYAQETKHAGVSGDDQKFSDCARLPLAWRGDSFMLCVPCNLMLSTDVLGVDYDAGSDRDETANTSAADQNGRPTSPGLGNSGREDFPLTQKCSSLMSTGAVRYDIKECLASLFGPLQRNEDSASSTPRTFATVASEDSASPTSMHATFSPRSVPLASVSDQTPPSPSINLDGQSSFVPTSPADGSAFNRRMRQLVCDCTTFVLTFGDKACQSRAFREIEAKRHPPVRDGKLHTCEHKCCCEASTAVLEANQRIVSSFTKYMWVHYGVHIRRANVVVLHAPAALATLRFLHQLSDAIPNDTVWQQKRSRQTVLSSSASTVAASEDNEGNAFDAEWSNGDLEKTDGGPSLSNLLDTAVLPTKAIQNGSTPDVVHGRERLVEKTQKNREKGRKSATQRDDDNDGCALRGDDESTSPHSGMEFAAFHRLDSANVLKSDSASAHPRKPARTEVPDTQNPKDVPNASTSTSTASVAHTSRSDTGVFTDEPHPRSPCLTQDGIIAAVSKSDKRTEGFVETDPIDTRGDITESPVRDRQPKVNQEEPLIPPEVGGNEPEFSISHFPITSVRSFVTPQGEKQLAFSSYLRILEDYRRACVWNNTLVKATSSSPNTWSEMAFPVARSGSLGRGRGTSADGAAGAVATHSVLNVRGSNDANVTTVNGNIGIGAMNSFRSEVEDKEEMIWSTADRAVSTGWAACGGAQLVRAAQLFDRDRLQYILVRRSASIALLSLGMQVELQRAKSVAMNKLRTAANAVSEKTTLLNRIKENKVCLHSKGQPSNFSAGLTKDLHTLYDNVVKGFLRLLALSLNLAAAMDAAAPAPTKETTGNTNGSSSSQKKLRRPQDYLNEINEAANPSQMGGVFRLVESAKVALGAIRALRQDRELYVETCTEETAMFNHDTLTWTPFEISPLPRSTRGSITGNSVLGIPREPLGNSLVHHQRSRSRDQGNSSPFLYVSQNNLSVSLRSSVSPGTLRAEQDVPLRRLSRHGHGEMLSSTRSGVFRNYNRTTAAQMNGAISPVRYRRSPLSVRLSREAPANSVLVPARDLLPDSTAVAAAAGRAPILSPGGDLKSVLSTISRHDSGVLVAEPNDYQSQYSSSSRRSGGDVPFPQTSPHELSTKEVVVRVKDRNGQVAEYREGSATRLARKNNHSEDFSQDLVGTQGGSKPFDTFSHGSESPSSRSVNNPYLGMASPVATSEASSNTNRAPTVVLLQSASEHMQDYQHPVRGSSAMQHRKDSQIRLAKEAEKALLQLNTEIINLFLAEVAAAYSGLTTIWEQHRQGSLKNLLELVRELTIPNTVRLAHVTAVQDALRDIQQLPLAEKHQDGDLMTFIQGLRDAVTQDHLRACTQELQRIRPAQKRDSVPDHQSSKPGHDAASSKNGQSSSSKKEGHQPDSNAGDASAPIALSNDVMEGTVKKDENDERRMLHPQPPSLSAEITKHYGCSARKTRANSSEGLPEVCSEGNKSAKHCSFGDTVENGTERRQHQLNAGHAISANVLSHSGSESGAVPGSLSSQEESNEAPGEFGGGAAPTPPTQWNGKRPTTSTPTRNGSAARSRRVMVSNPIETHNTPLDDKTTVEFDDSVSDARAPPRSMWRGRSATLNPSALATSALATNAAAALENSLVTQSDASTYSNTDASLIISAADLSNSAKAGPLTDVGFAYPSASSVPPVAAVQDVAPLFTTLFFDLHDEVQGNRNMQKPDVLPTFNDAFIAFLAGQPEEPTTEPTQSDKRNSDFTDGVGGGGVYNWTASSIAGASMLSSPALDMLKSPRTSRHAFHGASPRSLRGSVSNTSLSLGQSHSIVFTSPENEVSVLSARLIRRDASRTFLAQSESIFPHLEDTPVVEEISSGVLADDSLVRVGSQPDADGFPATATSSDSHKRAERNALVAAATTSSATAQSVERSRGNPSSPKKNKEVGNGGGCCADSRHDSPVKAPSPAAIGAAGGSATAVLHTPEQPSQHAPAAVRLPGPRVRRLTALPQERRNVPQLNREKSEVMEESVRSPSAESTNGGEDAVPALHNISQTVTETNDDHRGSESGSLRQVDVLVDSELLAFVYIMWVRVSDLTELQQWLQLHLDRYSQSLNSIFVAVFGELHRAQTETEGLLRKARTELDTVKQESNSIQSARAASHIEEIRNAAAKIAEEIVSTTVLNEDSAKDRNLNAF